MAINHTPASHSPILVVNYGFELGVDYVAQHLAGSLETVISSKSLGQKFSNRAAKAVLCYDGFGSPGVFKVLNRVYYKDCDRVLLL